LGKLFVIILLCYLPSSFAQDTLKLNLESSINLALKNNYDLKIAELEYEKAVEQRDEAFGLSVLPKLKGSIDYSRAIKRGEIIIETPFFSGSFPAGTENTLTVGATLEQPLFTGAVFYATRISEIYADVIQQGYYSSRATLIKDVKQSYYAYLLAVEFKELSVITLKAAEDNLKNTKALFDAGLVSEYDYVRAKVQVQNLIPQLDQSENSIELAKNAFRYVLGMDLKQEFVIEDSLVYNEIPVEDFQTSSSVMENQNYTLQQLKFQIELQDKAVSYEFSKHFPELYFNGSWQTQAQENDPRSFYQWRYKNSVYVGLNLRIPLFDGWQTTSRVQQAELDLMKAKEEFKKTDQLFKNQLDDLLLKIEETEKRIAAYKSTIDEAQLGYDISVKRFANGLGTQLENIDALVALTSARVNYLNAIFTYYDLHSQLEALLAGPVENN
jgi:outer membrane protein TolC